MILAAAVLLAGGPGLDAIFAHLADAKAPGVAVLVRRGGRTIFRRGYGVRDLRTFVPIGAHTNFRLASCTKQFTATAVLLLIREGKLRYDTRITELFPDFPAYGRAITVRHLLTHTSGLPDYEDLMGASWTPARQIRDQEVLELLERQSAGKFAPGTSWAYSNSGYVLLGLVVAKVSGTPFASFLRSRIFEPLRMRDTLAYVAGENSIANRAYGHTRTATGFVETDQSATSDTLGDGGVYSNVADLERWDQAMEKHRLLRREEMSAALQPVKLAGGGSPTWPLAPDSDNLGPGQPVSYGFGWFLDPWRGRARMWHFGSTMGFRSAIERFTKDRLTIVVLSNRTDLDPNQLALQAAELLQAPTLSK